MSLGRPMTDYESFFPLLSQLKVPDLSPKHWCDNCGWELAEALAVVVAKKMKELVQDSHFLSLSVDEYTSVDNQSWICVHVYVVQHWKRIPILLSLSRVLDGNTADNITDMVMKIVKTKCGLSDDDIAERLMCFGANGDAVFQGVKTGVTVQLVEKAAPYMLGVHCMAHRTNLAYDKALGNLPIIIKIEELCQQTNTHLGISPKRHLEFTRLAWVLETSGNKIGKTVRTRWISLHDPVARIHAEYKTLVVKMSQDFHGLVHPGRQAAWRLLDLLLDFQTFLAFPLLKPLLNSINNLIQFAQSRHTFVCDFVFAVKVCHNELFAFYLDKDTTFSSLNFHEFHDIMNDYSHTIIQEWVPDLNTQIEYLSFRIADHTYPTHTLDAETGKKHAVSKEGLQSVVCRVKEQCSEAAYCVIKHIDKRFPDVDVLNALGVVYPQFWVTQDHEDTFLLHLGVIKSHFCSMKSIQVGDGVHRQVLEPLNWQSLMATKGIFKMTMIENVEKMLADVTGENPLTKLWTKLGHNSFLNAKLPEWFKLVQIAIIMLVGSVEDERTFSTITYMKNKVRNRLNDHLDIAVKLYAQPFWDLKSFPYDDAYVAWKEAKTRLGKSQ